MSLCRLLFHVKVSSSGCWERRSNMNRNGYSRLYMNGKRVMAHIYSYEVYKRKVPKGHVIRHTCDNRCCCNPDHLVSGTEVQNMRDRTIRGRHNTQKLNKKEVSDIRYYKGKGVSTRSLAEEFNVSAGTIRDICAFRTWQNIS